MRWQYITFAGARHKRFIGGLVAGLVLGPLPALALTFTTPWAAAVSETGGPTPPAPTFADFTNNADQVDNLFVNMGDYQGSTAKAASTLELTRNFSIADRGQFVEFEHSLIAGFQNAGAAVTASVKDSTGKTVVTPIQLNLDNTSGKLEYFLAFQEEFSRLSRGNYSLDVKVQYFTNNKLGGWRSISAFHEFEFEGQ